ncbi:MAG: hypothetical protein OXE44_04695 [Nitrospinae bacterium]|nr:hypothetical protein [Nitrospinota bacterium]
MIEILRLGHHFHPVFFHKLNYGIHDRCISRILGILHEAQDCQIEAPGLKQDTFLHLSHEPYLSNILITEKPDDFIRLGGRDVNYGIRLI